VKKLLSLLLVLSVIMVYLPNHIFAYNSSSSYSVTIGTQKLPFSDYPAGSYFTDNGKACTDHNNCGAGASYTNEGACNCKCTWNGVALLSTSCYGFANMVFYRLFGHTTYSNTIKVVSNISAGSINTTYLYNLFSGGSIKPGAHIRTAAGHSMIFMGYDSSYIYTYEGNYDSQCRVGVISRTWSEFSTYLSNRSGIAFIEMPNNYPVTSKPSNCTITASDTFVQTGQSVTFTFTQSGASYWYCDIENEAGVRQHVELLTGKYSYTYTFNKEGKYKVFLKAANDVGWTNPYVWVTVSNKKPTATISSNSGAYVSAGTTVSFDFTIQNAAYWYFVVSKDGVRESVELITGKWNHEYNFKEEGEYLVELQTANVNGWTNPYVWVTVSNTPEKPSLNDMKSYYHGEDSLIFKWDKTGATTHYNLYIHKLNENGSYQSFENIFYAESGVTRKLTEGNYLVFIQSTNANAWDSVNSTWAFTNSEIYYFTVSNEYIPTSTIEWNGHMYSLYDYSVGWEEAKELCEEFGGHLATINSDEECEFMFSLVEQGENTRFFLGGTDVNNEGNWEWITAEEWLIDDCWNSGEPNNDGSTEHYLETRVNGWNDVPNNFEYSHGFVFERERPSNVQDLTPTATVEYNGHTYLLFDYSLTWHDAKNVCEELGGNLATATTEEEYNMLLELVLKGTKDDYFLGGTDEKEEGIWQWITGETWEYEGFWRSGEPNNYLGEEHYLKIDTAGVDVANKSLVYRGFICEIEGAYTKSTVTKSGAKLIIDTKVHNITAPYDILIVGYKDNRFVAMNRVPHDEQNSPYTLEGDIDEIKVMVWDGLSTLKPLCDAEEIPSSKWIIE